MPINKVYDVLVAGELNVDIILNQIGQFPVIGKEVIADQMTITLGSSSAIFASNLSVLGTGVAFAGMLADDQFGTLISDTLKKKGVHTDHIVYTEKRSTGATIALSFSEERAMVTYPGAMSLFSLGDIPEKLLAQSKHLHLSSIFLLPALRKDVRALFRKAKALGLTTSLDPQWDPEERWDIDFPSLLPDVDVFIPNENELRAMTGEGEMSKAVESIRQHANILIVKSGREGAFLYAGDECIHQPAFLNRNVVDTIGAGDSFGAGFVHQFVRGSDLRKCLEFGALTGAVSTTRSGGTTAFETLEKVREIAASTFGYKM